MSLDRTALRLAAVMALTNGFQAPWPTRAGPAVFDSRMDPIQGLENEDLVPMIIVTTEDHRGDDLSPTSGGPPFDNKVDLILDLSIGMFAVVEGNPHGAIYSIESEPELEAALDHFEWQVLRALMSPVSVWARMLHGEHTSIVRRIEGRRSSVYREREGNQRLSARQVIIECKLAPDRDLEYAEAPGAPSVPAPLGPLIDAIIADGGPYAQTAEAIRDSILGSPIGLTPMLAVPLAAVRLIEADHAVTDEDHEGAAGLRAAGVAQASLT